MDFTEEEKEKIK